MSMIAPQSAPGKVQLITALEMQQDVERLRWVHLLIIQVKHQLEELPPWTKFAELTELLARCYKERARLARRIDRFWEWDAATKRVESLN